MLMSSCKAMLPRLPSTAKHVRRLEQRAKDHVSTSCLPLGPVVMTGGPLNGPGSRQTAHAI